MKGKSEEKEITQYFLEHPDQYSIVKDDELIKFLQGLTQQALTEDEINFLYKRNAKRLIKSGLELQFIEKIEISSKAMFFVTPTGKIFLQEYERFRKNFEIF